MTYDKDHHEYIGEDFGNCEVCGKSEEEEVHTSFEQFYRECDEVFGI